MRRVAHHALPVSRARLTFYFCFRVKAVPVKLQAVTLAAKLLVLSPAHDTLTRLAKYVFALARYDRNYDVRDRGRMLQQLLAGVVPGMCAADAREVGGVVLRRAQVRVVLFEGKENAATTTAATAAAQDDASAAGRRERLGTLGLVLGRDVTYARILPDWLEHGVESSLRVSPDDAPTVTPAAITALGHVAGSSSRHGIGSGGHSTPIVVLTPTGSGGPSPAGSVPTKSGWADLDKFYASESEEDEEEDNAEEEGDSEEEDEDESEDGEEDGENGEGSEREGDHQFDSGQEKDAGTGAPRTPEEDDGKDEDGDEDSAVEQGSSMTPVR
jgi:AP-3 complex subunit beta